jgi:lycopene cyclase domain-containing protein
MKSAYFLVDIFTILVPFLFSFHPKLLFYKTWKAFFPAVFITGLIFIVWDIYFTKLGVWGFNSTYVCGIYITNLPVEEFLFFFCIPYSCVFTYHCLALFIKISLSLKWETTITYSLIIISLVLAGYYYNQKYTLSTFVLMAMLLLFAKRFLKVSWLGKFYLIYPILIIPLLIVDGVLTGTGLDKPIVWYNPAAFIGIRIMTVPVEDIFYGMDLIFINLLIYQYLIHKKGNDDKNSWWK